MKATRIRDGCGTLAQSGSVECCGSPRLACCTPIRSAHKQKERREQEAEKGAGTLRPTLAGPADQGLDPCGPLLFRPGLEATWKERGWSILLDTGRYLPDIPGTGVCTRAVHTTCTYQCLLQHSSVAPSTHLLQARLHRAGGSGTCGGKREVKSPERHGLERERA